MFFKTGIIKQRDAHPRPYRWSAKVVVFSLGNLEMAKRDTASTDSLVDTLADTLADTLNRKSKKISKNSFHKNYFITWKMSLRKSLAFWTPKKQCPFGLRLEVFETLEKRVVQLLVKICVCRLLQTFSLAAASLALSNFSLSQRERERRAL